MDNGYNPHSFSCGCKPCESLHHKGGCNATEGGTACEPCPETAGSDCSRCDNPPAAHPWGRTSFPPPCDEECMRQGPSVLDVVKVPKGIKPGKYVVGFRYDCDATAQVWSNCADITIEA